MAFPVDRQHEDATFQMERQQGGPIPIKSAEPIASASGGEDPEIADRDRVTRLVSARAAP
jgi:hypothetical protein